MNRKQFVGMTGGALLIGGIALYSTSSEGSMKRIDTKERGKNLIILTEDERQILFLASLAPSGHNAQPWFINYVKPYHWIICNDSKNWLPAVDPLQRETILSIGAFIQNLEYAANSLGYAVEYSATALTNQEENVITIMLHKARGVPVYNTERIERRRTLRSNYLSTPLQSDDKLFLFNREKDFFHFVPNDSIYYSYLNEQTIKANTTQAYRDEAQRELANWIRFSVNDENKYRTGLTTESMEIEGVAGWFLKHFYGAEDVMKNSFRERTIESVRKQVRASAGWLLITSSGNSVTDLIETGKRMERLFLKVRERGIAMHPMTQILEEESIGKGVAAELKIDDPIQFVIRLGYAKKYHEPVSLRRPIDWFIRGVGSN
jgi:hypothetical protein